MFHQVTLIWGLYNYSKLHFRLDQKRTGQWPNALSFARHIACHFGNSSCIVTCSCQIFQRMLADPKWSLNRAVGTPGEIRCLVEGIFLLLQQENCGIKQLQHSFQIVLFLNVYRKKFDLLVALTTSGAGESRKKPNKWPWRRMSQRQKARANLHTTDTDAGVLWSMAQWTLLPACHSYFGVWWDCRSTQISGVALGHTLLSEYDQTSSVGTSFSGSYYRCMHHWRKQQLLPMGW